MHFWLRLKNGIFACIVALMLCVAPAFAVVDLDTTTPTNAPFYGGYWCGGNSSALGDVDIFLSDNHGWTLNDDGFLFRYANNSASGVMYTADGTEYTFSAPAFSVPRYRLSNSGGYAYTDLFLHPTEGNIFVDNDFATVYNIQEMCMLFLCFMSCMLFLCKLLKKG